MSKSYGAVEGQAVAPAAQSRRTLAAVIAMCLTLAVAAVLLASFQTARATVVLDSFDPVSRGVYGPWKPVIRRDPSNAFNRHHILSGEMKTRPLELARERRNNPRFIKI